MPTLVELEHAIRACWTVDTSDDADEWSLDNPSRGQCDITSLVVHDLFGGDLVAADVYRDGERIEGHMWNRLSSGIEIDLTRDQFRRRETLVNARARPRPATFDPSHPRYHRYEQYLVLSARVRERLGLD